MSSRDVSQRMLDAGVEVFDNYDSIIHEMATTYDAFTQNRKSVELILHDIWEAMFRAWLTDGAKVQSVTMQSQKSPLFL